MPERTAKREKGQEAERKRSQGAEKARPDRLDRPYPAAASRAADGTHALALRWARMGTWKPPAPWPEGVAPGVGASVTNWATVHWSCTSHARALRLSGRSGSPGLGSLQARATADHSAGAEWMESRRRRRVFCRCRRRGRRRRRTPLHTPEVYPSTSMPPSNLEWRMNPIHPHP